MRLLLIGPPGAGKGTQAAVLSTELGVPHISTGEIFRANVAEGTDLGQQAKRYMEAGEYVPDEITNAMVASRLGEDDAQDGFLLDGYPRTLQQVAELDGILADGGHELETVLEITADTDELVGRLLKRAEVEGRADDTEEVIRRRMDVYAEQTAPLIRVYGERGILRSVDGLGSVEDVSGRLLAALRD